MKPKNLTSILAQVMLVFALPLMIAPGSWAAGRYKVLHSFTMGEAGPSSGALLLDKKSNLYGGTYGGGTAGDGAIFKLVPSTGGKWKEVVLYSFVGGSQGATPDWGLISDAEGNLYGDTPQDGGFSASTVFKLGRGASGWDHTVIHSPGSNGLTMDTSGDLFGFIGPGQYGAGAVSELTRGSKGWSLKTLYSFCSQNKCADGEGPLFPPTWDAAGNLYGTTLNGGNVPPKCPGGLGCGVAFQMTPNSDGTWKYHVLHRFAASPKDGQYPDGGLVVDASGTAYGVTAYGGVHGNGTVFTLTPSSGGRWKQAVLYDFPDCANGCLPGTTLVFDRAGDLYGVGSGGLPDCQGYDCGVVFKLTQQAKGKWNYSVVHKFTGTDGGFPNGVIMDAKGNLYGTTQAFGKYGYGVAFEITP